MLEWLVKYWLEVAFGLLFTGVSIIIKRFWKRQRAIEDGVRDILRIQILELYERAKQEEKISVSRKDAIDSAYNSYHALGGNGTITRVHEEIMQMPIY